MSTTALFETERLMLRRWRNADREPFARMNADPRRDAFLSRNAFPAGKRPSDGQDRSSLQKHRFGLWAVELRTGHTFAGFIGLNVPSFDAPFTPCVEIGWRIVPELWGRA